MRGYLGGYLRCYLKSSGDYLGDYLVAIWGNFGRLLRDTWGDNSKAIWEAI